MSPKIIIVEDEIDMANIYQDLLVDEGFEVDALVLRSQEDLDESPLWKGSWKDYRLVLLDYHLPINYRVILNKARSEKIPVILVTAETDPPIEEGVALALNKLEIVGRLPQFIRDFLKA